MFYQVDSRRVSLREFSCSTPVVQWLFFPLFILLKLLRVRLPPQGVVPDTLDPFLTARDDLPAEVKAKLAPVEAEILTCGFVDPAYHWITDPYGSSRMCMVTFRHPSTTTLARIIYRQATSKKARLTHSFLTAFRDGAYFVSSSGRRELLSPPGYNVQRAVGASVADLWRMHQQQLSLESFGKSIIPIYSQEEMLDLAQQFEDFHRKFHIDRGVLVPCDAPTQQTAEVFWSTPGDEADKTFAAVYQEIERLANRKSSWVSGILTLVITVALFFVLGGSKGNWKPLLLLGGVLFFHELGHLITMWLFRYRNLQMFFIPFLGAAVSGRNYNVAGWKKAIVSLMGPLPGIGLGIVLGVIGIWHHWPTVVDVSLMLLGINALNLLPILPMDGGQFMHAVLFSRHPVFDVLFRAAAALILIAGAGPLGMKWLVYLGIAMLVSLPTTYRLGKVVRRLRKSGVKVISHDSQTVPIDVARQIHREMTQVLPKKTNVKTSAQLMLRAFETLNADPPGWLVSINLIGVYGFGFFVAVIFAFGLLFIRHTNLDAFKIMALAHQPKHAVVVRDIQSWEGADAKTPAEIRVTTLIATLPSAGEATSLYQHLTTQLPACATATLFGQTVLVTLPPDEDSLRNECFDKLSERSKNVCVDVGDASSSISVSLMCGVPSEKDGTQLESVAQAYLGLPASMKLVPPWLPGQTLSEAEQKARRTCCELQNPGRRDSGIYADPRLAALDKKMAEAYRRGDRKSQKSLQQERIQLRSELQKTQRQKHIQQLREEGEEKWDLAIIDLLEKTPRPEQQFMQLPEDEAEADAVRTVADVRAAHEEFSKKTQSWDREIGAHLGQLPMNGDVPRTGGDRFSARWGTVCLVGPILRIDIGFEQPSVGLPALAQWLSCQGCFDVKYSFAGESENEEP